MTLILSGTNGVSDIDGDASTPAVRGTDANSGIFFGADTVGVSTGGSEKVSVGASAVVVNDGGADVDFRVEGDTEANLLFVDASADAVGVGTNTPSAPLHIKSSTGNAKFLIENTSPSVGTGQTSTFIDGTSNVSVVYDSNGYYRIGTSTNPVSGASFAERMRIDSSGNVGIGTSSPAVRVQINSSDNYVAGLESSTTFALLGFKASDSTATTMSDPNVAVGGTGDALYFRAGGTERARITSDGKFLLGNTDGPFLITVGSNKQAGGLQASAVTSGTTGIWAVGNTSGGSCQIQADFISSAGTAVLATDSGTTNGFYFRTYDGGYDYRFRIAASGSVTNSTGSYGTISDARTKTVVGNASLQWNDIKQLNFVKYKLNKNIEFEQSEENEGGYVAPTMLGLVAQEVEQICPGLIEESADPEFGQVKVIKTSILYMKAVKALQEAMERIETLEASNTALEARIAALETGA